MKKLIFSLVAMSIVAVSSVFAQEQTNYVGSSRFTDNVSVTLQGGVVTPFDNFFKNGSTTPVVVLGVNKEINPWFGVGVEGRTSIGVGNNYNIHTAFDEVNVNGNVRFNVLNMFAFDGTRKFFEPVVYTGLGWGHVNCSDFVGNDRNFMTYRAGAEFNFNLGKDRVWGVVVNPSVVWGDIDNGKLVKGHGNFEVTAGVVYRFNSSNDKRSMSKARLYDADEVARLNAQISDLQARKPQVVEKVVEKLVEGKGTDTVSPTVIGGFRIGKADLNDGTVVENLSRVLVGKKVVVTGYADKETGSDEVNAKLSLARANAVKDALVTAGLNAGDIEAVSGWNAQPYTDKNNRCVIVTVK